MTKFNVYVLADVDDPSWHGELTDNQVHDALYCFTDVFLGSVSFYDRLTWRSFGSLSTPIGLVGHLFATGSGTLIGAPPKNVMSYVSEWSMTVERAGDQVVFHLPDEDPVVADALEVQREVARALRSVLRFARFADRPVPDFFDEVDELIVRLDRDSSTVT